MAVVLLAPVPERHLETGLDVPGGVIALGARDERPFDQLDEIREERPIPVLFYATHRSEPAGAGGTRHAATWAGAYVGRVRAVGGRHPEEEQYRPTSTRKDRVGKWRFFYHVAKLRRLGPDEQVEVAALRSYATSRPYRAANVRKPRLALQ